MASKRKATRLRIGDILQINTPRGYAYAQYTHRNPLLGYLIRVFDGFHKIPEVHFAEVIKRPVVITVFLLWSNDVDRDLVDIVEHEEVPALLQSFPTFKDGVVNPATGNVHKWWLWDGEKEWMVGDLTSDESHYPLREIWNDILLVERVSNEWRSVQVK